MKYTATWIAATAVILAFSCASDDAAPRPCEDGTNIILEQSSQESRDFRLDSPYYARRHVFVGQLHAHTTNSDGRQSPAAVVDAYRRHGYDFVAITDHNHRSENPEVPDILFLTGVENSHQCLHENRIGARYDAPGERLPQDVIDLARREGSFVQINHPDWPGTYPADPCWSDTALLSVHGYHAVEVWNATCSGNHNRFEARIDMLLSNGRRTFLTAVDDCHDITSPRCMTSSVRVFADHLDASSIITELKSGNFYSSNGAVLSNIRTHGHSLTVIAPQAGTFEFISNGAAIVLTVRDALFASYTARGDERYIRVRYTGAAGKLAWTNPVYITGIL